MVAPVPDRPPSILQRIFGRAAPAEPQGERVQALTIAIASGKGGTGKSFFASNLACVVAKKTPATTIVDCDYGLGDAHLLLGANPKLSIQHVISGQSKIEDIALRSPFGPLLVPGGSGLSHLADLTDAQLFLLSKALGVLAARDEVLVLDSAAGIAPQNLLPALCAERVVLVTNPEIAALTDAYALVKCLAREGRTEGIGVVVNRVREAGQGEASFARISDVARRFSSCSLQYLGEIPEEPAVVHRRLGQAPLVVSHPECLAARAIVTIASRIEAGGGGMTRRSLPAKATLEHKMASRIAQRP
jgi:flagellar biosynthesis protein FlhG